MEGETTDYLSQIIQTKKGIFRSQIRQKKIKASLQSRRDILIKASEFKEQGKYQQKESEQQQDCQGFTEDNLLINLENNLSQALFSYEQTILSAECEDELSWEGVESVIQQILDISCEYFRCSAFQDFIISKIFSNDVLKIVQLPQNTSCFLMTSLVKIARKLLAMTENEERNFQMIIVLNSSGFLNLFFQEIAQKCNESTQISEFTLESACFILKLAIGLIQQPASSIQILQYEGNNLITSLISAGTYALKLLANSSNELRFPLALAICQLSDTASQKDFLEIITEPNFLLAELCEIVLDSDNANYVTIEAIFEVLFSASSMLEDNQFESIQARKLILNVALSILNPDSVRKGISVDDQTNHSSNVFIALRIFIDLYQNSSHQTEILNYLCDSEHGNISALNLSKIIMHLTEFQHDSDILNEFMSFLSMIIMSVAQQQSQPQTALITSITEMNSILILAESLQSSFLYQETKLEILQAIRSILVYSEEGNFETEQDQQLAEHISMKSAVGIIRAGALGIFEKLYQEQTQDSNRSILELLEEISENLRQLQSKEEGQ